MTSQFPEGLEDVQTLQQASELVFRKGGGARPDVRIVEWQGSQYVMKDYNACGRLFALLLGPIVARREANALKALAALDGVPDLICMPTPRTLLMEYLPDSDRAKKQPALMDAHFFSRLKALLQTMHGQGVAHCDLRRSSNILVSPDGQPYLVDFVSCVYRGPEWNPVRRWIFSQFVRADTNAMLKLKYRVAPELLTDEERQNVHHGPLDLLLRAVGQNIRTLLRWMLTGRRSD